MAADKTLGLFSHITRSENNVNHIIHKVLLTENEVYEG